MDRATLSELFAKAREADIEAVAGVKLFRAGRRMRGECPVCGASKGKRSDGAFSVDPQQGYWYCFGGCQRGGDVVDLEQLLRGGSLREAAERLAGPVAVRPAPRPALRHTPRPVSSDRVARAIYAGAGATIYDSLAGRYLRGRGISGPLIAQIPGPAGFNMRAEHTWDADLECWAIRAPAMVFRLQTPDGPLAGVHCTYLDARTGGKARVDPPKRMWGPQKDFQGRPGGVWLSDPMGPGPLIVGEGIESTLSAMQLHSLAFGFPCRGVATLSLEALQGGWLTDRWGRVDLDQVASDPDRPAFTWPLPDLAKAEVLIAVDRDMKPVRKKVRKRGGGTAEVELDSEARARICAGLAVQAWKRAGANAVRVIAPAAGRDFNDELKARVGA